MTRTALLLPSVLLVACSLGGCSSGQDRKEDTVESTTIVLTDVTKAKQQLSQSTLALTSLRDAAQTDDIQRLRDQIASSQSALDASIARVHENSADAVETGMEQSEAWQKKASAFSDSELRGASQNREGKLRDAVAALEASNAKLRTASQQYHNQAAQIVSALDLDSSYPGTRSVMPTLDRLVAGEAELRDALTDVAEKANAVGMANNE